MRITFINGIFINYPSVGYADSVSLRLGHAPALTVHRTVIHYRRAASLPDKVSLYGFYKIGVYIHI